MPDAAQLETFTAGAETAVNVAEIERQLRQLWELASEQGQITRACLFNFTAYCETEAERDHATEIISTLTSRHPCRAIVLLAQPDESPDELSASITAHCHLAGGGRKQVCCEQISIHAAGKSVEHLSAAVLSLLESDLPTVLWWQGNFLLRPDPFRRLSEVADRIFFDTSIWPNAIQQLPALARTLTSLPSCGFADLSWTRLGLWRRLTAEAFDEPLCATALVRVKAVEIIHGCGPGGRLRALLLGGWVAAQLKWSGADARSRVQLSCRDDDDATAVGVISIALRGDDFEVMVRKNHGERTATATVQMPDVCGLPRRRAFWPLDDASLLSQELDRAVTSEVYLRALTMAAELARE